MRQQGLSIDHYSSYTMLLALSLLLLAACQVPTPVPVVLAPPTATAKAATTQSSASSDHAASPVKLSIPALKLEMPIVPMGWEVVEANGQRATKWVVPKNAIGWHVNSAGAGAAGNTILSGHQAQGEALFAPLATGEIVVGQEIILTDAKGQTFTYRVKEVTDPIALTGASAAETARAASYIAPSTTPKLTLITGWPDFTTTHRIFAVADLVNQ